MRRVTSLGLMVGLVVASSGAMAGFSIEGGAEISSESGLMGKRSIYQREASASFRTQEAELEMRQKRYENARLLVDLAYKTVTQNGSGNPEVLEGYGDRLPFAAAASMILPTGWQLYQDGDLPNADIPKVISFIGGKTWPEVLGQVGERYALQFHIDWYDSTVMIKKGRVTSASEAKDIGVIAEPVPAAKGSAPAAKGSAPAPVVSERLPQAKLKLKAPAAPAVATAPAKTVAVAPVKVFAAAPAKPVEVADPQIKLPRPKLTNEQARPHSR